MRGVHFYCMAVKYMKYPCSSITTAALRYTVEEGALNSHRSCLGDETQRNHVHISLLVMPHDYIMLSNSPFFSTYRYVPVS